MNELTACTEIVTTNQIKQEFNIYFWREKDTTKPYRWDNPLIPVSKYKKVRLFNAKLGYILQEQEKIIELEINEFNHKLMLLFQILPERFAPKILEMEKTINPEVIRSVVRSKRKEKSSLKYARMGITSNKITRELPKMYRMVIKEEVISLIIQMQIETPLLNIFKNLCQKGGVSFDEYIDQWYKELIKDNMKV